MVIDAHCHIGNGRYKKLNVDELIQSMDSCGIDKSIIVPVEEYIAVNNEEGNEYILNAVKRNKNRLYGFAVANPWYGQKAVENIKRYLDYGLRGVKLNPSVQGFLLNDELVYPIIAAAQSYGVPVYFHTGTPVHSLPLQLRDLAINFPKVNFIMGHMGAHDFNYDIINAVKNVNNIFLETSMSISDVIERAINEGGANKVIFGSNTPRSIQRYEMEKVISVCRSDDELEKIFSSNILSIIGG
jgi:Predicted metal-dependent hydrolase of the TIM-barrel fold